MNKTKPIAALFDFDGVVMNTEAQYSKFWSEQGRIHHPEISRFDSLIKGQTLDQIFDKYFKGMLDVQTHIRKELDIFEADMIYEYVPGVESFIAELKQHNVKIAVVTSSNDKKMQNVYKAHPEIPVIFDAILTAGMFAKSKPEPDCFLLGAEVFNTIPERCFVFEDSFHGLEAGNRANMKVIGLATTNPAEAIRDKANVVIADFTEFSYEKMMAL